MISCISYNKLTFRYFKCAVIWNLEVVIQALWCHVCGPVLKMDFTTDISLKKLHHRMDFLNQLEQLIFKLKKYHSVILIFSSNNHHIQFVFPASFLKFHSSISLLTTSLYVVLGHPLIELAPTYNLRHLIGRNSLQILYITKT